MVVQIAPVNEFVSMSGIQFAYYNNYTGGVSLNGTLGSQIGKSPGTPTRLSADFGGRSGPYNYVNRTFNIVLSDNDSTKLYAYAFNTYSGFVTTYSDPTTPLPNTSQSVTVSPNNNAVAGVYGNGFTLGYVYAYKWKSGEGFGTRYNNPSVRPTDVNGVTFAPSGNAVVCSRDNAPYVSAYQWSSTTGFGTKYSDPVTIITSDTYRVAFSPSGNAIALTSRNTPFIWAYRWSDTTGFGTKYANPSTLPADIGFGLEFSPTGDAIAMTTNYTSPFVIAYQWTYTSGFGTKYANPSSYPSTTDQFSSLSFHPDNDAIIISGITRSLDRFVTGYTWSSSTGFGTKYAEIGGAGSIDPTKATFSLNGKHVAIVYNNNNRLRTYTWNKTFGFVGPVYDRTTSSTAQLSDIAFSS